MEGLKCYQCTDEAQKDKKCHFASSGDGPDDDTTWFGDLMECDESADHCMISRTRMLFTYDITIFCNILS